MNPWILVPCGFGFWWLVSGLSALGPLSRWSWSLLVIAVVLVAACGFTRRGATGIVDRRAFRISVLAEIVGIGIVVLGCSLSQRPDLIMPLIGTVVGFHLLHLTKAFNDRRFVVAGSLLASVCLVSLLWTSPLRMAVAGIGSGIVLWGFAVWTSLRGSGSARGPSRPAKRTESFRARRSLNLLAGTRNRGGALRVVDRPGRTQFTPKPTASASVAYGTAE
jgi:hypothetical protein